MKLCSSSKDNKGPESMYFSIPSRTIRDHYLDYTLSSDVMIVVVVVVVVMIAGVNGGLALTS
ncbi:MAG TPA: hypothetical protein VFT71_04285 [Candidatus Nitrosocosmicus sp.]|nr:hypothetical protein [Candidatus Nitrosocosmicus sp.]